LGVLIEAEMFIKVTTFSQLSLPTVRAEPLSISAEI
jgi:hypothetical protein